jgi:phosphatidylglycerol:prolipoprotein diacylglycerol transferase
VIPHLTLRSLSLGPVSVESFHLALAGALGVGAVVAMRRARALGLAPARVAALLAIVTLSALLGSRAFDLAFYQPRTLRASPLTVFSFWHSFSSFGAVAGTLLGAAAAAAALRISRAEFARFLDAVGYTLPFAWLPARLGCALVHDHLGVASDHWLAVAFPHGPRFDTGLLEFLYVAAIALLFLALGRAPREPGLFLPLFFVLYGPGRFALDLLRVADARYLGWTPGQFAAVAMTLMGAVWLLEPLRRRAGSGTRRDAPAGARLASPAERRGRPG